MIKEKGGISMDNNQILQQLADSNRKQERFARIQCIFAILSTLFCLLILLGVFQVLPQIQELAVQISNLSAQAETVLTNLEVVTEELAQADIAGMVTNVDSLVSSSQSGVEQALVKIEAIDIDALNKAIADLSAVISPLANLINRFR
jgi:predicted PurR-regulated permease PerM